MHSSYVPNGPQVDRCFQKSKCKRHKPHPRCLVGSSSFSIYHCLWQALQTHCLGSRAGSGGGVVENYRKREHCFKTNACMRS